MGNTQSIFYPDNPNRRTRAQQLANDCQYAQQQYDATKARLEAELGPYKEKLDKVLKAFDCNNIQDLDRLILNSATGDALTKWKRVRQNYDDSLIVDQVIMVAEGIVTIAGLAISAVGALAGGFGFFVGLGVTADILLVLGVLGAIYDIINGAIQREKLRDAINSLVPSRLKAKYVQAPIDQMYKSIPAIKAIYEAYEEVGYDKDKILAKFKNSHFLDSLKRETTKITYQSVGQELADMDSRRGSWTNEDPNWHSLAMVLDGGIGKVAFPAYPANVIMWSAVTPSVVVPSKLFSSISSVATLIEPSTDLKVSPLAWKAAQPVSSDPSDLQMLHDGHITMQFSEDGELASLLSGRLHIEVVDFPSGDSAEVHIDSPDDK
ncbi:hypothetical protein HGRIS_014883 [Hohenbuehelia grisea]|uniref:Uncharacterized protein n=1 Tax=Hohenbuehelia grisea TaxID=104357 RepID=A0ABR3IR25_9AGAR